MATITFKSLEEALTIARFILQVRSFIPKNIKNIATLHYVLNNIDSEVITNYLIQY